MDIYTPEGDLDIEKAVAANRSTPHLNNAETRKTRDAEVQIAALLDIATSLRTIALEAAVNGLGLGADDAGDEAAETGEDAPRDFLVVGDLVTVKGSTEPAEVVDLGMDQGEPFAVVDFAVTKGMRYYVRNLERLVGDRSLLDNAGALVELAEASGPATQRPDDGLGLVGSVGHEDAAAALREPETIDDLASSEVPLVGVATEAETPALLTDADEDGDEAVGGYELDEDEPTAEDLVDDIDADFDGAAHPAAEDALEVLKANEAARKARKKSGPKKGSKK
jgi:hypothetical protein